MPLSKKHLFTEELQLMANYGQVVSHPVRILMLEMLHREGILTMPRLQQLVPLTRSAISNHLRVLERFQLVRFREKEGETAVYALRRPVYEEARQLLNNVLPGDEVGDEEA